MDGIYSVRAKIFRPPSVRLGVLAADAAHTLRAALDMLAWQLALKSANPPSEDGRQTAFPICTHPDAWKSNATQRMVERIAPEAVKVIESLQPYRAQVFLKLGIMQAIDNWAKHHAIPDLMTFHVSRMRMMSSHELVSSNLGAFSGGDEICRVREIRPPGNPDEHYQAWMMCHVGFAKNGPGASTPIDFLENTFELIRDRVVPSFKPFFPE
ncbi:MAG: hypothetical protein EXR64_03945 [Dehalococcoidia bacterium]|nr:hypothetical protein [Dehalococcoidia bacterium]